MARVAVATVATSKAANESLEDFLDVHAQATHYPSMFTAEKAMHPCNAQHLACLAKNRDRSLTYGAAWFALAQKPGFLSSPSHETSPGNTFPAEVLLEVVMDFLSQQLLKKLRCASCGCKTAIDNDDVLCGRLRGWQGAYPTFEEGSSCLEASSIAVFRGLRQQRVDDALEQWVHAYGQNSWQRAQAQKAGARFRYVQEDSDSDALSFIKARMYASHASSAWHTASRMANQAARILDGLAVEVEKEGQWYPAVVRATSADRTCATINADLANGSIATLVPRQRVRPPASFTVS